MKDIIHVTLLCTSDVHGYYMPWDYSKDKQSNIGGLSRVSTIAKKIRNENPYTFLIDNGDLIQGNSAEYFKGSERHPGIEVINAMKYEIYNMGNHEFNFGMEYLISKVGQFEGVSMMGNLYRKKNTMRFMNGIYYLNIKGVKIGFISLNTPLVRKFEAKRGNLKNFDVIDADFELKKLLREIDDCDAMIGLFHMGDFNENDIENTGVEDLLNNVEGADEIDAIFAGHMHQVINKKIKNTIFLEPGVHAEAISRIDLKFDSATKKMLSITPSIIEVNETVESDQEIEKVLENFHRELRERANREVGKTTERLTEDDEIRGFPQTFFSQTKISDFFLKVMAHYSKADVVAIHFDNPYPDMPEGILKRKHINNSYSYSGGEITRFIIDGEKLKKYLEWTAAFFNGAQKGDINISISKDRTKFKYSTFDIFGNINYKIDLREEVGKRIKDLEFSDGRKISDQDIITIGMNKYRMDQLVAQTGPLAGERIQSDWSSLTDKSLEVKGTIRNLARKYFTELADETYIPDRQNNWEIVRFDDYKEEIEIAKDLINQGLISLELNDQNRVNLNKSVNIFDQLSNEDFENIISKYEISPKSKTIIDVVNEIKK